VAVDTDVEHLNTGEALAVPLEHVPHLTGLSRTRIFGAAKEGRLTVRNCRAGGGSPLYSIAADARARTRRGNGLNDFKSEFSRQQASGTR
jgi:hypothetical protein